jgi:DNA polymerase-3 subunit gamma/tau
MPYEVTASRRRPKTFDELAGQEFVAATLKNSLETGHIAHAYLFSGPRGCGKTSAARILAKALRCEKGPAANPCGVCPQCQETARGASMDVIEIDGASNTGVNDVRQIKEEVLFPPTSGRYKVYIIDEVHMLSNSAFNALLKTIEEPPPNVVFIFATTELQKVPATIKSRCQQFNFKLIPVETISALLREACDEMGIKAEDEALFWIARESTGSCRDAYTLFDQVVSFSGGHIRPELIREKLGLVGLDKLNEFAETCAGGDLAASLNLLDSILSSGVAAETFITDLAGFYHSLLLLKAGITRESVLGYPPQRFSQKTLEKYDTVRLAQAGELLFDLHRNIRYSLSPRFEIETLVSKLCWLDKWISPLEMGDALVRARNVFGGGSARPLAEGAPEPQKSQETEISYRKFFYTPPCHTGNSAPSPAGTEQGAGQGGSLTEEFQRYMTARANSRESPLSSFPSSSADSSTASSEPLPAKEETGGGDNSSDPEGLDPVVQRVLKVFRGTIIEENSP